MALKADGTVWTWGNRNNIGDNKTEDRSSPVSVVGDHSFAEISAYFTTNFARKSNGTIWAWGLNSTGEIGDNSINSRSSPVSVVGMHSLFARSTADIQAGDSLYWNGDIASVELDGDDEVDLDYIA
jgi:alpha-tubulin suppressor-like RCC1 family protein